MLLYEAPISYHRAVDIQKYRDMLERTQRSMVLRMASSYKTVALVALQLVMLQIHLMIKGRAFLYNNRESDRKIIVLQA